MTLDLKFEPDMIAYIDFYDNDNHRDAIIWGDRNIYDNAKYHIISLMDKKDGFFFAKKGLGQYQIVRGSIDD